MIKEEFTEQITTIEAFISAQRKAGDFINDTFFKGSTPSAFDFGDDLLNLAVNNISRLSGIDLEAIEVYLYEYDSKTIVWTIDGKSVIIDTPEGLWDNFKN